MNTQAGRGGAPERRRELEQQPSGGEPGPSVPPQQAGPGAKGAVHLKSLQSLERLRNRVEEAALELRRLREENLALAQRLAELEAKPTAVPGATLLAVDDNPELLQRKITGFIEAIDQYLKHDRPEA